MLSHKRILLILLSLTLFLALSRIGYLAPSTQSSVKIGVVLSTSGRAAPWGISAKNGIELAVREINLKGGISGQPLEIIYKDSKTNGEEAVKALRQLIAEHNIQVVIGDVTSTCVVAMAETANQSHVVLITPGASNPGLSKKGDFIFRYWYSDALEGKFDALYAKQKLNWQHVLTVYLDAPYGQGMNEVFVNEFTAAHGEVVQRIPVKLGQDVFKDEVERIFQEPKLDGIFLASYVYENIEFLKQLRARSIQSKRSIPILSTQTFNSMDIVRGAGDAANGVVFSVPPPPDPLNKAAEDFREAYRREYNRDLTVDPADFAATAYDSVKIVSDAFKGGAKTASEIRESLENQTAFQGAAFGLVNFDQKGDISFNSFAYKRVRDGKFEFLGTPEPIEIPTPKPVGAIGAFLRDTAVQVIGTGIVILAAALFALFQFRYLFWIWHRWQWRISRIWFWKRRRFNRSGRKIVTLHDYVDILEEFRNVIVKKCNNLRADKEAEIAIYSYTMQLPRDWPLWEVDLQEALQHPTPLERYFTGFAEFKKLAESQKYSVKLIRVIIIDSEGSPAAISRLKDLEEDVNSEYFQTYIDLLHTEEQDAYYYLHPRPWPGWLSDSVFYAVKEPNRERKWLWGVTTSYNFGEDLIILRLHQLGGRKIALPSTLSLPFEMPSLDTLAGMADGKMLSKKLLTSLRKGANSNTKKPAVPIGPKKNSASVMPVDKAPLSPPAEPGGKHHE